MPEISLPIQSTSTVASLSDHTCIILTFWVIKIIEEAHYGKTTIIISGPAKN